MQLFIRIIIFSWITVEKEACISITEKSISAIKCMPVNIFPCRADHCGNKEEQGALWHVKVGDHAGNDFELVTWLIVK